jgi:hypothetical protein
MDNIPVAIRTKLTAAGYVTIDTLPNSTMMERWYGIKCDCDLSGPELNQLMNTCFPLHKGDNLSSLFFAFFRRTHPHSSSFLSLV